MCWKCEEIDKVILRYRILSSRVTDRQTLDGLKHLIEKLEAEKKSLHPEQQGQGRLRLAASFIRSLA
jgi:hypothetical protein